MWGMKIFSKVPSHMTMPISCETENFFIHDIYTFDRILTLSSLSEIFGFFCIT